MNESNSSSCTLCANPATIFAAGNFGRYKAFDCKGCGQFAVSDSADSRIRGLPIEFEDAWRAMIRSARPDQILLITVTPVGSGGSLTPDLVSRSTFR